MNRASEQIGKSESFWKGRKHDQVLDGAWEVFLRLGYDGATVDLIAQEAGVSKATLYSYFPDKRMVFIAAARLKCERLAEAGEAEIVLASTVGEGLTRAAAVIMGFYTSDFGLSIFRMFSGESGRFPELGPDFFAAGPAIAGRVVKGYLAQAVARGDLVIDDIDLAAEQFIELSRADIHNRLLFGMIDKITDADRKRVIDGAVQMFLARYGAKPPPQPA